MTADRSALPILAPDRPFRFPRERRSVLPCGLPIRTIEHRGVPVLALVLIVRVGAADDPAGRPGLAALAADVLDEGTGALSALDVHDEIARIGGQFETETGYDATVVTLLTLSRFRDRAMRLLADVAFAPRIAEHDVERVRTLRLNRLRQLRDIPGALAEEAFARHLYGTAPYGHLPIGTPESLSSVTTEEVRAFHRRAYRLDRCVLIAVGDDEHGALAEAASRTFGAVAAGDGAAPGPAVTAVADSPPDRRRLVIIERAGAPQSELRIGRVGPPRRTPDYHAIVTLNNVLGGQFVSRINSNLREEKGYTYGARSAFDFRLQRGPFVVQAGVHRAATVASIREVLRELEEIRGSRPATPQELDVARATLTRGYPRSFETAEQLARALAQLAIHGLPDDYYDRFVDEVLAIDTELVTRAALRWLATDDLLTVIVGDPEAVLPGLEALGMGEPIMESAATAATGTAGASREPRVTGT